VPRRAATDHLSDVLQAIDAIASYTKGGKEDFDRNEMIRDAVAVRLIQIGQAVKDAQTEGLNLPKLRPEIAWRKISGMRDLLAHKYARFDPEIAWRVIQEDFPPLKTAIAAILRRARKSGSDPD
jgi:uncharacterized protein with HEPN domain